MRPKTNLAADTTDEYELEDRKERERAESAYAERVKLYQDLMHEAGKSQNIDRLKDSLRAREGREKASREALYRFPDPSDAYAALSEALDAFSDNPSVDPSVIEDIRQGLAELEAEHGPRIRSGMQGALAAAGYPELDSADGLRDLYRQTVCDFTTSTPPSPTSTRNTAMWASARRWISFSTRWATTSPRTYRAWKPPISKASTPPSNRCVSRKARMSSANACSSAGRMSTGSSAACSDGVARRFG